MPRGIPTLAVATLTWLACLGCCSSPELDAAVACESDTAGDDVVVVSVDVSDGVPMSIACDLRRSGQTVQSVSDDTGRDGDPGEIRAADVEGLCADIERVNASCREVRVCR